MMVSMQATYDLFLASREVFCAPATLNYYTVNVGAFVAYLSSLDGRPASQIPIEDLTLAAVNQYIVHLRKRDRFEGHPFKPDIAKTGPVKNTTIRTYLQAVKTYLNYCYEEGYCCQDLTKRIKLPKDDAPMIVPLYQDEVDTIDALYNRKSEFGLRNLCIVHLMLDAGLRSGEVIRLRMQDLLFSKNVIMVYQSKGCKSRAVLMCPKLKSLLYTYCLIYRSYVGEDQINDQQVFLQSKTHDYINDNVIKQLFARIKHRSGIARLHPHLLRHTFATSYILGGGNLEMLRMLLGHYDYSVTRKYVHLANQYNMLHADIYMLDKVFFRTLY